MMLAVAMIHDLKEAINLWHHKKKKKKMQPFLTQKKFFSNYSAVPRATAFTFSAETAHQAWQEVKRCLKHHQYAVFVSLGNCWRGRMRAGRQHEHIDRAAERIACQRRR